MSEDTAGACRFCGTTTNRRDCKGLNCCKDRQYEPSQAAALAEREPDSACDPGDICAGCRCKYNTYGDHASPFDAFMTQWNAAHAGATWKLVPVEPTETMVTAANEVEYCEDGITRGQLRAAINAAPTSMPRFITLTPSATAAQGATLTDAQAAFERNTQNLYDVNGCAIVSVADAFRMGFNTAPTPVADSGANELKEWLSELRRAYVYLDQGKPFFSGKDCAELAEFIERLAAPTMLTDERIREITMEVHDAKFSDVGFIDFPVGWPETFARAILAAAKPVSVDAGGMTDDQLADIQRAAVIIRENSYPCPDKPHSNWALAERIEKIVAPLRKTPPTESTGEPSISEPAIVACAVTIKAVCILYPEEQWLGKIQDRIRCMLNRKR